MKAIPQILEQIGLTDSEIKVYLALLEMGDSTRSAIVNDSRISGSKVYEVLERLQQKGLVSIYIQNKVKHFKATNPNQIMTYLEEKHQKMKDVQNDAKSILPTLLAAFESSKESQEVELMSGVKGMDILFREQVEILKRGETCFVIGGTRGSEEEAIVAFFQKIHLMREAKGIKTRMLYNINQKQTASKAYGWHKYPGTTTRYIIHNSPVAINIYKDRTAIIIFGKSITTIHIKSQDVATSFLEYFELLWKTSKA
jgi:HTH-type transcriptional regulator, sugar sensing transcriptional regulator